MALTVVLSALWGFELLNRTPGWQSWLRPVVLIGGLLVGVLDLLVELSTDERTSDAKTAPSVPPTETDKPQK